MFFRDTCEGRYPYGLVFSLRGARHNFMGMRRLRFSSVDHI